MAVNGAEFRQMTPQEMASSWPPSALAGYSIGLEIISWLETVRADSSGGSSELRIDEVMMPAGGIDPD